MASGGELPTARWRRLVTDRIEETQRLSPERGSLTGSFWEGRADRFAAAVSRIDMESDPLLRRLRRVTGQGGTIVDVGAGTGRFALPLAQTTAHVTAVEPAEAMLAVLRRGAEEMGVGNLTTVTGTWEEADVAPADVVFSSFVLTLVAEARPFVEKLEAVARREVFLYLGAYSGDATLDPLWRHFHGAPRSPAPTYLDALAVLRELGIEPAVTVVELPNRQRFATVDEAVDYYRDGLLLDGIPDVDEKLRDLLRHWLMGRRGAYRSPLRTLPAAIVSWRPRAPA